MRSEARRKRAVGHPLVVRQGRLLAYRICSCRCERTDKSPNLHTTTTAHPTRLFFQCPPPSAGFLYSAPAMIAEGRHNLALIPTPPAHPPQHSATMASARKRPRAEPKDNRAECPFTIKNVDPKD